MKGAVLVVGAGAAGLTAARALAERGVSATVVDKGRGVGGRLATRRLGDGRPFDHGAVLFETATEPFRARLAAWEAAGLVERVAAAGSAGAGAGAVRVRGGAASLAKHLARDLDVRLAAKAVSLARDGDGFALGLEDGDTLRSAAAILTPPVPQALDLLARGGLLERLPASLLGRLGAVTYEPGLVLLLRIDRRAGGIPGSGILELRDGGPIARVVENARAEETSRLSVYARASVAARFRETSSDEAAALLEEAARAALGLEADAVVERDLKRWRYARPSVPFPGEAALAVVDGAPLLFAGDAFGTVPAGGSAGLERAALSGLAAAGRLLAFPG